MSDNSFIRYQNFIDTNTTNNFKLALDVFNHHDSLLHGGVADPDLLTMYNFFHPFQVAYNGKYVAWENLRGQGTGGTQGFTDLLNQLSNTRIRKWDIAIQQVYDQGTPQYRNLLPHRRRPFQQGAYVDRVSAVSALLLAIGSDVALFELQAEVENFIDQLTAARDAQVGGFGAIEAASTALETARLAAAEAMFKNYGSLVVKYYLTPQGISDYMPTELLQSKQQSYFTGLIAASTSKRIFKRKLDNETQQLTLRNEGDEALDFFFTDGLTDAPTASQSVKTVQAHSQIDISPSMAGYSDEARYLYVRNNDNAEGSWTVDVD